MSRNYGITSVRTGLGGNEHQSARHSADTRADLTSSDREFGAFCFALLGLTCPFALVGSAITVWLLFC